MGISIKTSLAETNNYVGRGYCKFCFSFFLFNSEESQARNLPTCQIDPADSTKMKDFECYSTPTIYEITIY